MQHVILSRVNETVELQLPHDQAGFRKRRSATDQISRLTHAMEQSFQRKEKYGLVLIDLTAAYDTVWHQGLYLKLLKFIPDLKLVRFIMLLIQDRSFFFTMSDSQKSRHVGYQMVYHKALYSRQHCSTYTLLTCHQLVPQNSCILMTWALHTKIKECNQILTPSAPTIRSGISRSVPPKQTVPSSTCRISKCLRN